MLNNVISSVIGIGIGILIDLLEVLIYMKLESKGSYKTLEEFAPRIKKDPTPNFLKSNTKIESVGSTFSSSPFECP